jgi:hypothetical protein
MLSDANGGQWCPKSYFWPLVQATGQETFWKKSPMGGEIRPELQKNIFNPWYPNGTYENQDIVQCVEVTHCTWLLNQAAFGGEFDYTSDAIFRANYVHARMGYNYIITRVGASISNETVDIHVTVKQIGMAPFYYDLALEIDCEGLKSPRSLPGVESIIEKGETKNFTFSGIPATAECLHKVSFALKSSYAYDKRPIRFAQGLNGSVSLYVPSPRATNVTTTNITDIILGFTLVSVSRNTSSTVGTVQDGETVDLAEVGSDLSLQAETNGGAASVEFYFDGSTTRDSESPYALNGNVGDVFFVSPYLTQPGNKTINATAFDASNAVIDTLAISFQVIDTALSIETDSQLPLATPFELLSASPFALPSASPLLELKVSFAPSNFQTPTIKVSTVSVPSHQPTPAPPLRAPSPMRSSVVATSENALAPTNGPYSFAADVHAYNTPATPPLLDLVENVSGKEAMKRKRASALVIGATLGAATFLLLAVAAFLVLQRRRDQKKDDVPINTRSKRRRGKQYENKSDSEKAMKNGSEKFDASSASSGVYTS